MSNWQKMIEYIEANKDFLMIIITALIGVGSIIIGISTIFIMNKQSAIIKGQFELQQAESQPTFRIYYETLDLDKDKVYDTQFLKISNEGRTVKHIKDINVKTFIAIESTENLIRKHTVIPITGYYFAQSINSNLTRDIFTAYYKNNHLKYCDLYKASIKYSKDSNFYFPSKYDIVKIKYINLNNTENEMYFRNNIPLVKEEYDRLINLASGFQNEVFDIDKITFEDLLKCIDNE